MTRDTDLRHMAHALRLARRGLGNVWPNPAVGCVIIRDGLVVGRGWTQPGGRPHAERMALQQAGHRAAGATAYVTLEPCAHHGHTPPCAEALIAAGVARVVSALTDPDPRVAGRGHAMLRAAGIEVSEGFRQEEARLLQRGFLARVTEGRPMVTLKLACSLDGRIATGAGESQWITGPLARRHVHALRLGHDAVLVGGGTARADIPALNVREMGDVRQPVRVVLSRGDFPTLPAGPGHGTLWHLHGGQPHPQAERAFQVPERNGALDLHAALAALAGAGLTRVLCEGGGQLAAGLIAAGLVDTLAVYHAGLAIGADGRAAVGAMGLDRLSAAPRFTLHERRAIGPDLFETWHAVPHPELR